MAEILQNLVANELKPLLAETLGAKFGQQTVDSFPLPQRSRNLSHADLAIPLHRFCASLVDPETNKKPNLKEFVPQLAQQLNERLAASESVHFIHALEGVNGYFNIKLNKPRVFEWSVKHILEQGLQFGHTSKHAGQRVVIEHTSSNPNAPLHIGNLRNVLIGAFLANVMKAVGYDVKQYFFVNDLGAQIGLTVLAYSHCYDKVQPTLKIDQWIGMYYAIANTLSELQLAGLDLLTVERAVDEAPQGIEPATLASQLSPGEPEELVKKRTESIDIYINLLGRFPELMRTVLHELAHVNIKEEAGKLNLKYENADLPTVKIYRKMVMDCLSGVQQTLDTYGVLHDRFDFESELGWEGSNQRVLEAFTSSPYFHPRTETTGGYIDLDQFIRDSNLPQGRKGYQKDYPRLFILRPDGSTLYYLRDIVYSMKKAQNADLVFNVICTEQNLAQEKIQLGLRLLDPEAGKKQYHLNYELVRLTSGKMSGRRGIYVLADDIYNDLKAVVRSKMQAKWSVSPEDQTTTTTTEQPEGEEAQLTVSQEFFDQVTHEVSTAAMKYALLNVNVMGVINFDLNKVADFDDASAPFLLYNYARLCSVFEKFESRHGASAPQEEQAPLCALEDVDFAQLGQDQSGDAVSSEWELLMDFLLPFPDLVESIACPPYPARPALPVFPIHLLCEQLIAFVRCYSSYYRRPASRVIQTENVSRMHARLWFFKALQQYLGNGLRLLTINPLERM